MRDVIYLCHALLDAQQLSEKLVEQGVVEGKESSINQFTSPENAYAYAMSKAGENDRILVFGSFLTVAGVMKVLSVKRALKK